MARNTSQVLHLHPDPHRNSVLQRASSSEWSAQPSPLSVHRSIHRTEHCLSRMQLPGSAHTVVPAKAYCFLTKYTRPAFPCTVEMRSNTHSVFVAGPPREPEGPAVRVRADHPPRRRRHCQHRYACCSTVPKETSEHRFASSANSICEVTFSMDGLNSA